MTTQASPAGDTSQHDCAPGCESHPGIRQATLNSVYGLMVVPFCPHEGCGWSMPELSCPQHGNFGMTFLSVQVGRFTHVKAVLQ